MTAADLKPTIELLVLAAGADKRHRLTERLTSAAADEIHYAFVAERAGTVIGAGKLTSEPVFPGTASTLVAVAEEHRGGGVGTALAAKLSEAARELPPGTVVTSTLRDDLDRGRRFAERYGLAVTHHSVGWRFDLAGRGEEVTGLATAAAERAGIRIQVTDLKSDDATVMACVGRTLVGLPVPGGENQDVDLAQIRRYFSDTSVVLLAEPLDPGQSAPWGLSIVDEQVGTGDWYTVYTGVEVARRGAGVASALKTAALRYAYDVGAVALTTHNDDTNEPILRLNRALGMAPSVGYWSLAGTPDVADPA
ncbi:acetyltransferase (GNAT) family protein [Micromonospora pisi]|uniref:Acetyltransferase (GNAT) family protein n=2 Tax=Micromonospora pisi TaxID=589240 RepID=A0A495JV27_9ACTN|nr:acetyltransferase (GNAT) family protein [Micromonospora pisi]